MFGPPERNSLKIFLQMPRKTYIPGTATGSFVDQLVVLVLVRFVFVPTVIGKCGKSKWSFTKTPSDPTEQQ